MSEVRAENNMVQHRWDAAAVVYAVEDGKVDGEFNFDGAVAHATDTLNDGDSKVGHAHHPAHVSGLESERNIADDAQRAISLAFQGTIYCLDELRNGGHREAQVAEKLKQAR